MDTSTSSYAIPELLAELGQGSEAAFARLFDHYHAKVLQTAFQVVRQKEMAEDIVQDVFMKCWAKRAELAALDHFEGWLFVVTRNHALSALRRMISGREKTSEATAGDIQWVEDTDWRANLKSYETHIRASLAGLTEQQRRVFELSHFEGMSRAEIAEAMGLSPNTIKMHLVRAMRHVRAHLSRHIDKAVLVVLFYRSMY